jgi:RNA polymerase primary sigma factor
MAGDKTAQSRLIELFLPQVVEIAKLYAGQGAYLEDLIGEGNVALTMGVTMLGALENAAEAEGMLAKLIMDGMEEYIGFSAEQSREDQKAIDLVNKVCEAAREMSEDLRKKITPMELAKETGIDIEDIEEAIRLSGDSIEYFEGTNE